MRIEYEERTFEPFKLCFDTEEEALAFAQMVYDSNNRISSEIWNELPAYIQNQII